MENGRSEAKYFLVENGRSKVKYFLVENGKGFKWA